MAKALRVFVIVLLLLSIAALVLGILLFGQREVMKSRTQKLEQGMAEVAQRLTAPKEPHVVAIDQRVDGEAIKDIAQMDGQITLVGRLAETRLEQYFQEGEDHVATKTKLTQTELELATTRQQLADTRAELASARDEIVRKDAEIATKTTRISELEEQVAGLNKNIEDLRGQIATMEENIQDEKSRGDQLQAALDRIMPPDGAPPTNVKPGLTGEIITVNSEWNFVVLNIGRESTLVPFAEMLVHRGDDLIGKVRVLSVTETLAIADILRDWQIQPLQEGDRVLF